jgi:hypothetical protein
MCWQIFYCNTFGNLRCQTIKMHQQSTELNQFLLSYEHLEIMRVLYECFNAYSASLSRVCAYEQTFCENMVLV